MKRTLAFLVLALLPTLALAQAETSGRLSGTVTDEAKQPIVEAEVTLDSKSMQGQRTLRTDTQGKFLASLLPPGTYTVTVTAPNKTPREITLRLGVGQNVPLDIEMTVGQEITEEVEVYAPAAKMETTAGGENFNYKESIDQLPVTDRTLESVAQLAPNVTNVPNANNISISGAPTYDNTVLLDGADISDPFYSAGVVIYAEEAIEEVQVLTNGVSARYGRFQGGVLNATTKSGGNTFDGQVRADLHKESMDQRTPFVNAEGEPDPQSDSLDQYYATALGGPIKKDHLWFFLSARTIPELSEKHPTLVTPDEFESTANEDRYQIKLTGSVNSNHTIEASYLDYSREQQNIDPFEWVAELPAVIPLRQDPRKYYTAEYEGVLTPRTFLTVQLAKKDVSIISGGDPSLPSPILESIDGRYQAYANGWFDPNDPSVRNNESAAANITHVLSTRNWGSHTIEYGLQYVNSITAGDNRQSPTGFNLYLNTPTGDNGLSFADCSSGTCLFTLDETNWFNERLKAIPGAGEQNLKNTALYAQDSWEIGKWRLDLGLRWESWEGEAISPAMNLDFDALAPRLGVTLNLTPEWQAQATYGEYVSRFNDNVANGVSGISSIFGPGILQEYSGPVLTGLTAADVDAVLRDDANWGAILGYVNPLQPTTFFADDVNAPYAQDITFSLKRALPQNRGVVTLTYDNRKFENLLDNFSGPQGTVTITLPDNTTTEVDRVVWDNCSECKRNYEAFTATWEYRPGAAWNLGGNYTYAKNKGNYEGEALGQPSIGSIVGTYPGSFDPEKAVPYGYVLGDVRQRFRGWGDYRFDFGRAGRLTTGGIFSYTAGSAYSETARIPTLPAVGVGVPSSYVAYFGGRGSQTYRAYWSLDTTFRYDVSIAKGFGAFVKLDLINVSNEDTQIAGRIGGSSAAPFDTFVPNANYGTARDDTDFQRPREFHMALGVNW